MKLSGNMCLKIIWKDTKNQGFPFSLEDTVFEKPQEWGRGGEGAKLTPQAVLELSFNEYVSSLFKKAGRKLSVLSRLSNLMSF